MSPPKFGGTKTDISASRPHLRATTKGKAKRKSRTKREQSSLPEPDKASNESSAFLKLPTELKLHIVEFLPSKDIPALRLISEGWAAAGAPSLFREGFALHPHLDDMEKLKGISNHSEIAKGVKFMLIFAGDADRSQLECAINREMKHLDRATGGQIQAKVWKYVDAIYESTRLHRHCDPATLIECVPLLQNLEYVAVTSYSCPVAGVDIPFQTAWESMEADFDTFDEETSHFLDYLVSIKRYAGILCSVMQSKSVKKLHLDAFPIDIFRPRKIQDRREREFFDNPLMQGLINALQPSPQLKQSLSHIQDLQIAIVGCGHPHFYDASIGRTMAEFIGCFQNLYSLDISYEEDDDRMGSDESVMGFEDSFFRLRFPHLHSVRIAGTDSDPISLGKFLFKHRLTLKNLYIGEAGVSFEDRTHKDVLTDLRDHMMLERFELCVDGGPRLYDEEWRDLLKDGRGKKDIPDAKLLELYVVGRCPWPMVGEQPRGYDGTWKRKFMGSHLELLDLSEEELRDLLGEDWETEGDEGDSDSDMEDIDSSDDDDDDDSEGDEEFFDAEENGINGEEEPAADAGDWEDVMDGMDVD